MISEHVWRGSNTGYHLKRFDMYYAFLSLFLLLTISKYFMRQHHVSRIRDTETYINRAVIVTTRRRYTYLLCALRFRVDDLIFNLIKLY